MKPFIQVFFRYQQVRLLLRGRLLPPAAGKCQKNCAAMLLYISNLPCIQIYTYSTAAVCSLEDLAIHVRTLVFAQNMRLVRIAAFIYLIKFHSGKTRTPYEDDNVSSSSFKVRADGQFTLLTPP